MKAPIALFFMLCSALACPAQAAPWVENKQFFTENAGLPSSMVDAADLDDDGYVDLVFANGDGYDKGTMDSDVRQQSFHNDGGTSMIENSEAVFGFGVTYNGRAVKLRDIDGDDDIDIVLGTIWGSQSQLLLNDGLGNFTNKTATNLPPITASIGDIELGDIDGDGDLDMLLADWGQFSPVSDPQAGGVTQVWTQMGVNTGLFEDATLAKMQNVPIRWSWDLELVDVNNDYTLDLVVSCFACDKNSVYLFANDGDGNFSDVTLSIMGQGQGALDVESVDLNGDSFLDLVSLHDAMGGRNRVLINDKMGGFVADQGGLVWPMLQNPSSYDHMVAVLDYNSDALPDLAIGALQPGENKYPNRLMQNMAGKLFQNVAAFEEAKPSAGTYGIVLADFNLDRILDMAMSQNENAFEKKVFLGTMELTADTAVPRIPIYEKLGNDIMFGSVESLRVRAHDNKSPVMPHDFQRKVDEFGDGRPYVESWNIDPGPDLEANPGTLSNHGVWFGEALWKITFMIPEEGDRFAYRICAIDAAHNKACTALETIDKPEPETTTTTGGTSSTADGTASVTAPATTDTGGMLETSATATAVPTTGFPDGLTSTSTTSSTASEAETNASTVGQLNDGGCICNVRSGHSGELIALLFVLGGYRRGRRPGHRRALPLPARASVAAKSEEP
jgi:hypothetical protein